jgi:hypothetical protein
MDLIADMNSLRVSYDLRQHDSAGKENNGSARWLSTETQYAVVIF